MTNIIMDSQILTTLMMCPRLTDYRFNQNLRRSDGKSNSLECGSIVHAILEHYNKARIKGESRLDAIEEGYRAGKEYLLPYSDSNKYILDKTHPGIINTPDESDKYKIGWKYVFATMEQYFDYYKNDSWTCLEAEVTKGEMIYSDDDLRIIWKAKFDELDDTPAGILPMDTKTMKQRRESLSLNNQFIGQCILAKSRNMVVNKIGFQTSLKPNEKFDRVIISYSADRLAEWQNEIVPHYARMLAAYNEAENFPPNFTSCETKYGFCDFKEVCESDRNMRSEDIKRLFVVGKEWDI